ncbi:MAG: four helix bundle protein [Candidatus Vogelbacteria bacterium]|nr:four helix bundle protein [Candidatus Vogelbacteria bacterium]
MGSNIIQEKSFHFALNIVRLSRDLVKNKKEYILSKQILRSATSIGANVEEAIGAQSRKDFISKFAIAHKEARETDYWLRLLKGSELISKTQFDSLSDDCNAILRITAKIQKTAKSSPGI